MASSGAGFQRLTVNEFVAGSIPVGHPLQAAFDYWLGRLLLKQQEGDRYSYAVLGSVSTRVVVTHLPSIVW